MRIASLLTAFFVGCFAALPAQTGPAQTAPTLRVFLLAGQSNMEGHGVVDLDDERDYNGGRGTLATFLRDPENAAAWPGLRNADGTWVVRK